MKAKFICVERDKQIGDNPLRVPFKTIIEVEGEGLLASALMIKHLEKGTVFEVNSDIDFNLTFKSIKEDKEDKEDNE